MISRTQLNRWAGALFVLFPIVVVVSVILQTVAVSDGPDPSRSKIAESLEDINDNEAVFLIGIALDTLSNVFGIAVAALLYVLFRGRNRLLAVLTFAGVLAGSALFMLIDVGAFTVTRLAEDFVEGGAGGASGAEVLEVARAVVLTSEFSAMTGGSVLGLALVALGALLVWAPPSGGATDAASTMPRWIGWLAGLSGVLIALIWLSTIERNLFVIPTIGFIGSLLMMLAFAWWLLKAAPEPAAVE